MISSGKGDQMFEKTVRAYVRASYSGENLLNPDDSSFELTQEDIVLSLFGRVNFFVFGFVGIGERKRISWNGFLPFYLVKGKCGHTFLDYPHGFPRGFYKRFDCPVRE
jgi:hypothetical protein